MLWNETGHFLQLDGMHYDGRVVELGGCEARTNADDQSDGQGRARYFGCVCDAMAMTFRRRGSACIAMYMGLDRYDAQFTIQGRASDMQGPTLKNIARQRRLVWVFCGTKDVSICFCVPGSSGRGRVGGR